MTLVLGARRDETQGRAAHTFNVPLTSGQYAPEIFYCNPTPSDSKTEYLHIVKELQALIESLPTGAALEVDLLKPGQDPSPDGVWATVGAARGTTDTRVATTAFDYWLSNRRYTKAAVAAGTPLPDGTIPVNTWGGFSVYIDTTGALSILAAANNFTSGYASSAAADTAAQAIATPSGKLRIARFTVQTKVGSPFVCGTDALAGGTSGNVANATNYTNESAVSLTANWYTNLGPTWNSVGLKTAMTLTGHDGVRVRAKSGGTAGAMPCTFTWK